MIDFTLIDTSLCDSCPEILLPDDPAIGQTFTVKDVGGEAGTVPIIVKARRHLIENQESFTIHVDYGSVTFLFAEPTPPNSAQEWWKDDIDPRNDLKPIGWYVV